MLLAHPTYGNKCSDFQRYIGFLPRMILNLPGLQQNLSLEIDPICNVELYYQYDNTVDSCVCDECKKSKRAKRLSQALDHFVTAPTRFVHGLKNVKSTNSCQIQAFQDDVRTYIGQFSNRFQLLLLEVVIIQAGS